MHERRVVIAVKGDKTEIDSFLGWLEGHRLVASIRDLPMNHCLPCADLNGPSHHGSQHCKSGSIASGGVNAHCACDTCF